MDQYKSFQSYRMIQNYKNRPK